MFVYLNVLYSRVLVKDITLNTTVLSKLHKTTTKNLKKISINSLNYKKKGGGRQSKAQFHTVDCYNYFIDTVEAYAGQFNATE